jgi:hypothetical protein
MKAEKSGMIRGVMFYPEYSLSLTGELPLPYVARS